MSLTVNITAYGFTIVCIIALLSLGLNFMYNVYKGYEEMKELAVATLLAEVFIFGMWLSLCWLNTL